MDGEVCNINKQDQKKRINISKIDKVFKVVSPRFQSFPPLKRFRGKKER